MYTYNYICVHIFMCKRLPLRKICLCCFLDMHLYSNNLSTIALISSLIMSELFPACFFILLILFYDKAHQDQMIKILFLKYQKPL